MEGAIKPKRNLETHRFGISPESIAMMKETRDFLKKFQEEFPEAKAMAFFGSRILGKEHPAEFETHIHPTLGLIEKMILESDLDMLIFYDGNLSKDLEGKDKNKVKQFHLSVRNFSEYLIHEKKLPNNLHFTGIDISDEATKEDLFNFKEKVDNSTVSTGEVPFDFGLDRTNVFSLAARFLLSVGNIYEIRKAILDDFSNEPKGEEYWRTLMKILENFERPKYKHKEAGFIPTELPTYKYPQRLAEACKYFLTTKEVKA